MCAARTDNVEHARCLLACGASTVVKHKETGVTALGLARQYGNTEVARLIAKHRASGLAKDKKKNEDEVKSESEATKTSRSSGKRKSHSPPKSDKNEEDEENEDDDDAKKKAKTTKKANKENKEKEAPSEREEELALEADVRRLAGLDKTDVFALRQLLRTAGMQPSEIPRRKVGMLRAAVERLTGDDADALLAKCRLSSNVRKPISSTLRD
jgi:hypothetical protein